MSTGQSLTMYTYSIRGENNNDYMVDTSRTLIEVVEFTGASEVDGLLQISSRPFIPKLDSDGSPDTAIGGPFSDDVPRQVPVGIGVVMFHLRLQIIDEALGSQMWDHSEPMN
eukprot:48423-Eustigmatos_ZCMA.PRE.1